MLLRVLIGLRSFASFAQGLRASKPPVGTHFAVPFRRNGFPKSVTRLAPFPRLRQSTPAFSAAAYWRCQNILNRAFSSASTRRKHEHTVPERSLAASEQQTSLIAVPVYETSPASVGIDSWFGYEEFISPGTTLPCTKTAQLVSAFDYIQEDTIQVYGYLPGTRLRVDLAELTMHGIRKAKKEKTTLEAIMLLRTDLTGTFTTRVTPEEGKTRTEASINFCGGQVLVQGNGSTGLPVQSSSINALDQWHQSWMLS